jgi:hypothetical protein
MMIITSSQLISTNAMPQQHNEPRTQHFGTKALHEMHNHIPLS